MRGPNHMHLVFQRSTIFVSFVPHLVQLKSNSSNVAVEIAIQLNTEAILKGLIFWKLMQ